MAEYLRLLSLSDEELARFDLVEMNLLVAKSIPALAHLDIPRYQRLADEWAEAVQKRLPYAESVFHKTPWEWRNDIDFFRLGVLCGFLDCELGIAYREDQRDVKSINYTDASDLFLNGVMDTLRGTCGSMATLHVAIGRRLGWPVSLAYTNSHLLCRYDDGRVTHNIETTQTGQNGFKSETDEAIIARRKLPPIAIESGSDMTAMTAAQMLAVFIGFRARHIRDCGDYEQAELDYLLARRLFPNSRRLYLDLLAMLLPRSPSLFGANELGSPASIASGVFDEYHSKSWYTPPTEIYGTPVRYLTPFRD